MLSLVVPCHNEAANLDELYRQTVGGFTPGTFSELELILVDDGSRDETMEIARRLAADPRVRVLSFSRNFGKEAAMFAGLKAARGDAVIIMDADLQHPPALMSELIQGYAEGYHQVVAVRDRTGDAKLRTLFSRLYYRLVNRMIDVPLQDGAGDFRLLSRKAVDALLSLGETNRFSKGLFSWIGMRTKLVPYKNQARFAGETKWRFRSLFNYGVEGIMAFNDRPLRAAIKLGFGAFGLFVLYLVWLLVNYFIQGVETPGYLTTIAAIVGVSGIQLVFLGVLGEYIGKIYAETKSRPIYIIEDELNAPTSTNPDDH